MNAKTPKKKRPQWVKEGKFRYLNRKLNRMRKEMREGFEGLETRMRVLTNTLGPFMEVDENYILKICCEDEADEALLEQLRIAGPKGITPTEISQDPELKRYRFKPYHVTRRIQRMNKRLKAELGKHAAESYSRRWVITRFVEQAWSETKEELERP